jgi:hypothetical protein
MLRRLLLLAWLLMAGPLLAAEIEVANAQLTPGDDGYVLSADFNFEINPLLEDAINRGVTLHFLAEFDLAKPRWYWLDEKLFVRSQVFRLSYHPLTRQYRLATGGLHQSFSSLTDALRMLSRLRNWVVIERGEKGVHAGETYLATVSLRLDVTQLPRPFQIAALGNKEWSLNSERKPWQVVLPPLPALPAPAGESK